MTRRHALGATLGSLLAASLTASADEPAPTAPPPKTYRNPLLGGRFLADPECVLWQGTYYLSGTTTGDRYDLWTSRDLLTWTEHDPIYRDERGDLWAPDLFHWADDNKWYLSYTCHDPGRATVIGCARADRPEGPYSNLATIAHGALDAHLFRDDDGQLYLYHASSDADCQRVVARKMINPWTPATKPVHAVQPDHDWERHGLINEAPFMLKHAGIYYLMYSGSAADTPFYGIGYATATNPLGPFKKSESNPIAGRSDRIFGPGHHSVVAGPDGRLWLIYHQKRNDKNDWDRFLAMDPLWFDDQGAMHAKLSRETDEPAP